MAGIKIFDLPPLGRDLASTDLLELSLAGGTGSRKITGQEIMNTSKLNIGTTAITSGVVGRVLFEGAGNVVQESANLFWDNVNGRLGIGTSTPLASVHSAGSVNGSFSSLFQNILIGSQASTAINLANNIATSGGISTFSSNNNTAYLRNNIVLASYPTASNVILATAFDVVSGGTGSIQLATGGYGGNPTKMTVFGNTGNVLIQNGGTHVDAGFRLDINGTARVSGAVTISSPTFNILTTTSSFLVDTSANNYRIANLFTYGGYHPGGFANNTIDIFSVGGNPSSSLNGSAFFRLNFNGGNSGGIYGSSGNNTVLAQLNATTTSNLYLTAQGSGLLLSGGTNNALVSTVADGQNLNLRSEKGTGRDGGGINYLSSINGSFHSHRFFHNNVEQMRLQFSGNLLINTTTDAGFKLDVNGTARVSGQVDVVGLSTMQISTAQQGNSRVITFNTNGAAGGWGGGYEFKAGTNTAYGSTTAFRIYIDGRIGIGNVSDSDIQLGSAQLYINNLITGGRNAGVRITSAATTTQFNGIQFDFNTKDNRGGAFMGVQYNPLSNGYGSDLVVLNTTDAVSNYVEIARFMGKFSSFYVGTDKTLAVASAKMQVESTTQGFLSPRMTQVQRNAIASPAIGLEIYQTDATEGKYIYKSSGWTYIG